eukprot:3918098-Ditylum_brightwellii.AAC.1
MTRADQTLKGAHSVDEKTTSEGTEDTISQVTEPLSARESKHSNETGEDHELLSIDNNEQFNEKDQDVENEAVKDKLVVEEPAQKEIEKNVMTMTMLTCKQCLLQQRHAIHTKEELEPGENPTTQE